MNDYDPFFKTFISLIPLCLILLSYLLNILSLRPLAMIYLLFCIYCQFNSKIHLIYNDSPKIKAILNKCQKTLTQKFRPLFFFPMPIFQTSLAPLDFNDFWGNKNISTIKSHSQRVPSAETVLDWVVSSKESLIDFTIDDKPKLLVILPGLTGSVNDGYIKEICYQALNDNYRPVVYNARWLTNPVVLPKQGFVDPLIDFKITVDFLHKNYPNYRMFAAGTSHGANIMTRYFEAVKDETPFIGAVSIGNYFDLYASWTKSGAFWRYAMVRIMQWALNKQKNEYSTLSDDLNKIEVQKALSRKIISTVDFDEYFSRRLMGYNSVEEYYKKSGSKEGLENIRRPILFMQSLDDPICHYSEIPMEKSKANENLVFYITNRGGHCAWVQGFFNPSIFFPKPALAFLEALN